MYNLRDFRKKHELKQSDLADLFECNQTNISLIERQLKDLTKEQMKILIDNFGESSVMEFFVPNSEIDKIKSQLIVDPNSPQEQMRQSYLELIAELLQDNKRLNMEIKSLLRENTKLVKELAENKKAGANMDAKVADAV
jgi:transcriptional regulator with XRE-family HTH domain